MNNINIVVFNAGRASHLLTDLRSIVESARHPGIQLIEFPLQGWEASRVDPLMAPILSEQTPDALILVLDTDQLERARMLLPLLRKAAVGIPVLVIADTEQPKDVLELIRLGADDFITPPLSPLSVLPRLWRLLDIIANNQRDQKKVEFSSFQPYALVEHSRYRSVVLLKG